ncbi:MAG: hypothetical protein CFE29_03030 [Bradyrhizobiaceae bacterium PARB1]|nr:MAG: hypothetical protein CFE29_03030 [Bradyrhizobiaceae bacterium PARB1]
MLKSLVEPWRPGEFLKDVLERCMPLTNLKYSRLYEIWYDRAKRVEPHEVKAIADALAKKNKGEVWREITELKSRLARLETIVAGSDEEFGQPTVPMGRTRLRVASGANRAAGGRG